MSVEYQDRGKHHVCNKIFPQTEQSPVLSIQEVLKNFEMPAFEKSKSFLTLPSPLRGGNEGGG